MLQSDDNGATFYTVYAHRHYAEMHRTCYAAGAPCAPTTYESECERWELHGADASSITVTRPDGRVCARCGEPFAIGDAIVTYTYWWDN